MSGNEAIFDGVIKPFVLTILYSSFFLEIRMRVEPPTTIFQKRFPSCVFKPTSTKEH
jgi:hypothetical protein